MQSQQLRYKKLIRKVRVVLIDRAPFVLLSDVRDTFQRPIVRFLLNGEPIGFTLDDKYRPLEPLRISVTANNDDIIDCEKAENTKYNSNNKKKDNDAMLAEIKRLHDKVADIDLVSHKILENTDVLIKKADAILRQTFELAEYSIPRLFIILPETKTSVNPANWWTRSYRLFFICECENERHLAFHEGYEMKQVREFLRKYGLYVQKMLTVVRAAIAVSSFVLPQMMTLLPCVEQSIPCFLLEKDFRDCLTNKLNTIDHAVDNALRENIPKETTNAKYSGDSTEGVELREIESFLKCSDNRGTLGNLYRSANENGQVRWLCLHHYRQLSSEKRLEGLRQEFRQLDGEIRLGTAVVENSSAKRLEEMLDVICRGLVLIKLTLKSCKIRVTVFDRLLSLASQRNLIGHIEFQDVMVYPPIGFPKTHREVILKLEEALNSSKHLTIEYIVRLDAEAMKKDSSLLTHFAVHSTRRLSLHLYANDIIERFSSSGLSDSDIVTIREWICKSKSSWNVRPSSNGRHIFVNSPEETAQSLFILTNVLLRCHSLRELSYYQITVEEDVLQVLCTALEQNTTSLQALHFEGKDQMNKDFSMTHIASMFKGNNTSSIELSNGCVTHIVRMLNVNISLKELSLPSISSLHADDTVSIIEALHMHKHLCAIKIGCIRSILREPSYNVFDRLLNGMAIENFTCVINGCEQLLELRNALENNKNLKILRVSVLNINHVEITDGFCQNITRLSILETFSLSFDAVIDCSSLFHYSTLGSSLQSLSLTRVSNWQKVTNLINSGCKLKSLSLSQCDIDFNGIEMLVASLKSNPQSIMELGLSENNLSDDSAIKLGGALISDFFSLTMLDLSRNSLSLACILCLVKMLHFNTALKVLDIRACLKQNEQEKYDRTEMQECKNAVADLAVVNEFIEIRWND